MDEVYRGWEGGRVGGGVGWVLGVGGKPKGGNTIHKEDKQQCCVFSIAQKQTQSTW